ncbi:putative feruloyl esterase B-1 [Colletotrichum viniferum]|nr:putative feruloyl esterase B-1 [Colletotrichum viniferum]
MVRRSFVGFAAQAIGAMATLANSHAGFQQYCEPFNASTPSTSGVCFASTYVPAGTELQLNEVDATFGQVPTSDRSGFWFEAWLPEDWSGRFLTTGAAVLAGSYSTMMWRIYRTPFLHNLDVVQDFAYRSIEKGVSIGK